MGEDVTQMSVGLGQKLVRDMVAQNNRRISSDFEYFVRTVIISRGHILRRLISSGIGSYGVLITGFDRKPIQRDFEIICANHKFVVGRT